MFWEVAANHLGVTAEDVFEQRGELMILPYNDADKIAAADDFLRTGGDSERAAAYLGCRVQDLPRLGLPVKPATKPAQQSGEFDLWAADRLQEVL
jgi:hypothetical protein